MEILIDVSQTSVQVKSKDIKHEFSAMPCIGHCMNFQSYEGDNEVVKCVISEIRWVMHDILNYIQPLLIMREIQ